jgi:hypothetical protein
MLQVATPLRDAHVPHTNDFAFPGPARYGGVVDGIDNMMVWYLWWKVCTDRASPVCVVEEERRKEASETWQRLHEN